VSLSRLAGGFGDYRAMHQCRLRSSAPISKNKNSAGVLVVVPARMGSSRYPGKPLVKLAGIPMVEHVRRRSLLAKGINRVVVATCDEEIRKVVEAYGGEVVMTSARHERCSERVAEAARGAKEGIIVNVQGDEPLMHPEHVEKVLAPFRDPAVGVASLLSPLNDEKDIRSPAVVKAVCRVNGDLLFYTRSPIPHFMQKIDCQLFRETGIRAFQSGVLQTYANLPQTPLEKAEAVDMLRFLEHGIPVRAAVVDGVTSGVDFPADVAPTERILATDPVQKSLLQKYL
jgi:3-deoxy-manno-octulosonate cytidylyltransferase (CMP-KDO synthetase)